RTDPAAPLPDEVRDEMAPDEAAAAGHHDQVILPPHRSAPAAEMARDARADQNRSTASAASTPGGPYTRRSSLEHDRQDERVDRVDLGTIATLISVGHQDEEVRGRNHSEPKEHADARRSISRLEAHDGQPQGIGREQREGATLQPGHHAELAETDRPTDTDQLLIAATIHQWQRPTLGKWKCQLPAEPIATDVVDDVP